MTATSLNSRLRNCLLTILELQGTLEQTSLGTALQNEFIVLRGALRRLENVHAEESDVCRIEAATNRFLAELKAVFDAVAEAETPHSRHIQ